MYWSVEEEEFKLMVSKEFTPFDSEPLRKLKLGQALRLEKQSVLLT